MCTQVIEPLKRPFTCTGYIPPYECEVCPTFQTNLLTRFREHLSEKHTQQDSHQLIYKCLQCDFTSYSKFLLIRHTLFTVSHSNLTKHYAFGVYQCKWCLYTTHWKNDVPMHVLTQHTKLAQVRASIYIEGKDFPKSRKRRSRRGRERRFRCTQCSYSALYNAELKSHILLKHTSEDQIQWLECEQCAAKFKLQAHLNRHAKVRHPNPEQVRWFDCDFCNYKCKQKYILNRHIKLNHVSEEEIRWFKCAVCPFKTKRKRDLVSHNLKKHGIAESGKYFQCPHCAFRGIHKFQFNVHLKTHSTEESDWFKCDYCEFKTIRKFSLKEHLLHRHTDPAKIEWCVCEGCGFKGKTKHALQKHVRRVCGKGKT